MIIFLILLDLFFYNVSPLNFPLFILGIPFASRNFSALIFFLFLGMVDIRYLSFLIIFILLRIIERLKRKYFRNSGVVLIASIVLYYCLYYAFFAVIEQIA